MLNPQLLLSFLEYFLDFVTFSGDKCCSREIQDHTDFFLYNILDLFVWLLKGFFLYLWRQVNILGYVSILTLLGKFTTAHFVDFHYTEFTWIMS